MRRLRNLFSVKPLHPIDAEGRMALGDHFRELRGRLMRSVAVVAVLFFVGIYFNEHILELIMGPYNRARAALGADVLTEPVFKGVGGPFLAILKMSAATAIIAGSPVWLYQLWRYILPALHKHERKWSHVFIAVAGPLFLGGVALGYYILPKGLEVLIGFTFTDFKTLVEFDDYFSFLVKMLLVFGISLEIPLFAVLLNLMGILPGRVMAAYRPWIVVGTFIFAAIATPSTDAITMTILAVPMLVLFLLAEVIMRLLDRARGKKAAAVAIPDDQASPLP